MIRKICQFVVLLVVSPLVLFSLGLCLAWATVDGDYFAFAGMSLGDLVTINQHIAEAIRKGRRNAL